MLFKTGDIVLNFRRSSVYLFDESILQHRKETFSCRIATLQEQKAFKALGQNKCKFSDIGLKKDWANIKTIKLEIEIGQISLWHLNRVGEQHSLNSYEDIIRQLISAYNNPGKADAEVKELANELKEQDDIFKQISELLQKRKIK